MTQFVIGNLFESTADALVNTVNCVGVMGKGIALQFKERYPENFKAYNAACKAGEVALGKMFVVHNGSGAHPQWIINFPTKGHWRSKSKLEDVVDGLKDLTRVIRQNGITSIAIPPLGCGLGGLDWQTVKPLIESALADLPEVTCTVYEPATEMAPVATAKVTPAFTLTPARAALVSLADFAQANIFDPCLTLLKVHKLLYFLQAKGVDLRLTYEKAYYGPYATNLRHVLNRMEGTYLKGFTGESEKPNVKLKVLPNVAETAQAFLQDYPEIREKIHAVEDLLEGYESTLGMELLSSVHWVCAQDGAQTAEEAYLKICKWTSRKARLFSLQQVADAFATLYQKGWLTA